MPDRKRRREASPGLTHDPSIAPGMNTHDSLEEKATEAEIAQGDSTSVTSLFLDRTPED